MIGREVDVLRGVAARGMSSYVDRVRSIRKNGEACDGEVAKGSGAAGEDVRAGVCDERCAARAVEVPRDGAGAAFGIVRGEVQREGVTSDEGGTTERTREAP